MIKLKLTKPVIRLLYKFIDVEMSGDMALVDDRMIEYSYALSRIIKHVKSPAKILDVGCVARINPIPETLCELNYNVTGIDVRVFNYQNKNFKFIQDNVAFYNGGEQFDCASLVSTLEHIGVKGRYGIDKNDDYADYLTMQNIRELLCYRGIVVLTVPFNSVGNRYGVHRIYDDGMIKKLFSNGFEVIERKYYERQNDILVCKDKKTNESHLICLMAIKI